MAPAGRFNGRPRRSEDAATGLREGERESSACCWDENDSRSWCEEDVREPIARVDVPLVSDVSEAELSASGSLSPAGPPSSSSLRRALSLRLTPFGRLRLRRPRELASASAARATAEAACESSS
jgi:hypothetical protein